MKKEKEIPAEILSQEEINSLLTAISTGEVDEKYWLKDSVNVECLKANLKKIKKPQDYIDVVMDLIRERDNDRKTIKFISEEAENLKTTMKLAKDFINRIL